MREIQELRNLDIWDQEDGYRHLTPDERHYLERDIDEKYEAWEEQYKPITDEEGSLHMYDNWKNKEEWAMLVSAHEQKLLWTCVEVNGVMIIDAGMRYVDRCFYVVCSKPYEGEPEEIDGVWWGEPSELHYTAEDWERYDLAEEAGESYDPGTKMATKVIYANLEAYRAGKPLPYSKEEYSNEGVVAWEMRHWNKYLPEAEQFSKEEHSNAMGLDAAALYDWNKEFPNAEQYSKAEYSQAEGFNATAMFHWNKDFPNAEQFTEEEIAAAQSKEKNKGRRI